MEMSGSPVFRKIDIVYIIFFFVSFAHSILCVLFMLALLYYWRYGVEGGIKVLLLITTRGIISTAVAAPIGSDVLKWIVLLGTSLWIMINAKNTPENAKKINRFLIVLLCFAVLVGLSSFIFSSYPVTSVFKIISFSLPFAAIVLGVGATIDFYRWIDYFVILYTILFAISFVLIPFEQFRIVNDDFQGVFNHVNILGVICAIYIASVLNSPLLKNRKVIRFVIIAAVLIMEYLSKSRTGMFTVIAVLIVYFFFNSKSAFEKVITLIIGILAIGIILLFLQDDTISQIQQGIYDFIWKNNADSILESRQEIISTSKIRFESNRLLGTGFMVPYIDGFTDYSLNFSLIVEPGNILWALLGDTGIIGTTIFVILLVVILTSGNLTRVTLFIAVIAVNLGEMVFFSSNNMSILLYFLVAIYMFSPNEELRE